jgi:hypothetical protein
MTPIRLTVQDAEFTWSGMVSIAWADRALAALSADPTTLSEWESALQRFAASGPDRSIQIHHAVPRTQATALGGDLVIDLAARLIVCDSPDYAAETSGGVPYHDGDDETETILPFHLDEDWLLTSDLAGAAALAESRRKERVARPCIDARPIFYGRPLLEFLAAEVHKALSGDELPLNPEPQDGLHDNPVATAIRRIHADWLMTPRADLAGATPREIALARHNQITWDMQDRCQQWSMLDCCPPALDQTSFAWRFAGFGTHELVLYYELVRELLWSAWDHLAEQRKATLAEQQTSTSSDNLLSEAVERLGQVRDAWLNSPHEICQGRSPASVIARERARLPEGGCGHDAIVDPDCPCCQMLAELPGPTFWHLDGCNMDDDFAFDISYRTREEWEEKERRYEEFNRRFNAQWAERERLGLTDSGAENSIWKSSFIVEDESAPLGVRLFGIGARLAELFVDLRSESSPAGEASPGQPLIDRLNRDFGNLRNVLQSSDSSLTEALIQPVIDRLIESLAATAAARPELLDKCDSLTQTLTRFLDPEPDFPSPDWGDSDVPF